MKKGLYGIYQGKEYQITRDMNRNIFIQTEDKSKVDSDFIDEFNDGVYTKIVYPDELKNCMSYSVYGLIKNEKIDILKEKDNQIEVGTYSIITGDELNLERVDRDYWMGWIPKEKVKIIEDKIPFNPNEL